MAVDVEAFRQAGWERSSYLCMAALLVYEYCECPFCSDLVLIDLILIAVLQLGNEASITNVALHEISLTFFSFQRSNIFG
jgi:hypothetical protein